MGSTPVTTSKSRVFLIEGRARGDHKPSYESCARMGGLSQSFGDIERIECPDPFKYGGFIEVGQTRGATERPTTTIEGRYMMEVKSTLMELARRGCAVDVQLHMGKCQNPSEFDEFEKIIVIEEAHLTAYNTDDLGALASGDDAVVNENVDVSAKEIYEVLPVAYGSKAGSLVTNEVVDVVICDNVSCGDCEEESTGCDKIFAITKAAGGSPSTSADVLFSLDKGLTWQAHDIDTIGVAEDPDAVECLGAYLVVASNDSNSLHYAPKSEFDGITDPTFAEVGVGFVAAHAPNALFSTGQKLFVAGDGGYIYETEDVTAGVIVVEAGTVVVDDLRAIHGLSDIFVVAVGDSGAVIYTENGNTFNAANRPVGFGITLNCVWVKTENEWWVGASNGRLYYTLNRGLTWTEKAFSGSGAGSVRAIGFSTDSVGWLAHSTAAPRGRILRTYNGGYTWRITPEKVGATMPVNDYIGALAYCSSDPNFVVGVGLADDGTDGFIVVGQAS